ncbi:MAG: hypothetical protein J5641_00755 [Bacteroidales bacterium]|nr:hypothetical protein [Bacteroidales bacterium]
MAPHSRITKKFLLLLGTVLAVACVKVGVTDLGDDYYYTWDYPLAVCKRVPQHPSTGVYVLPPHDGTHDDFIVVNVYWDDKVVLAVCCETYHSPDSTCWMLDKASGLVTELSSEEFDTKTSGKDMKHEMVSQRYHLR